MACTFSDPTPTSTPLGVNTFVASSDFAVGVNRFAFAILDEDALPVRLTEVRASLFPVDNPSSRQEVTAVFRTWPTSVAGVYAAQVTFDEPGIWEVEVEVPQPDGSVVNSVAAFQVKEESDSPAIGAKAPASQQRTAGDVEKLAEITTASPPDPDLYQKTIAEAVASGLPSAVVFSTPAFCETRTCGPQVEVVEDLKERYKGLANFIHVEVYANPLEMQGDLTKGKINPAMNEWGLLSEPWTFILDRNGNVAAKFEGFVGTEELEPALTQVL